MSVRRVSVAGDSLTRALDASSIAQGGFGGWFDLVSCRLSNVTGIGPLISSGIIPVYAGPLTILNTGIWTRAGSWTATVSTDAWDKVPYGTNLSGPSNNFYASGSSNTLSAMLPINYPPAVGYAVHYLDYTSMGDWSLQSPGGSFVSHGQTIANDNKIGSFYKANPVAPGQTVNFRGATAGGSSAGINIYAIEFYYLPPSTTNGCIFDNISFASTELHEMVASTSGDRLAIYKGSQQKIGSGSPISLIPNAGSVIMHVNDVFEANATQWGTDLATWNTLVSALGPVAVMSYWEASTATFDGTQQAAYRQKTKDQAVALGFKTIDFYDTMKSLGFTGNAAVNGGGFIYPDLIHENQAGHFWLADLIYWFLRNGLFA